jgi:hypothetical protein
MSAFPRLSAMTLRTVVCAAMLLALPVLTFEMARHSVHHLGSADRGCLLASAASSVSALSPERAFVGLAAPGPIGSALDIEFPRLRARPTGQQRGRAPPPPASA